MRSENTPLSASRSHGPGAWGLVGMKLLRKPAAGFKAQPSTYKLSVAPTGRARCRVCKQLVGKGELRLETCAFVMPGRRTVFVTHATCVTAAQARDVMSVYRSAERVPVGVDADAVLVERACSSLVDLGTNQR